jgi:hypothetical protein
MAYKPRTSSGAVANTASTAYPTAGVFVEEGQGCFVAVKDVGGWTAGYATMQLSTDGTNWYNSGFVLQKDSTGFEQQAVDFRANSRLYVRLRTSSTWAGTTTYEVTTQQREVAVG